MMTLRGASPYTPLAMKRPSLLKKLKIPAFCTLLILGVIALDKVNYLVTGDFRLANICYEKTEFVPAHYDFKCDVDLVKEIAAQTFHYIGKGHQNFAFESEDSKYVIKFFKFRRLKKNHLLHLFSNISFVNNLLQEKRKIQKERFFKMFEGYAVGYAEDPEGCALRAVHLNKTDNLKQTVCVKDKLGFKHTIDLDSVVFVIQEKVIPAQTVFEELFKKQDIEGVKVKIAAIFDLYLSQYQKGLCDHDDNLANNIGFLGDSAIRLDVGKLEHLPVTHDVTQELALVAANLSRRIFQKHYPEYYEEITLWMQSKLSN